MLLQMALFLSFLWLSSIPLYMHHTFFIHYSVDGHLCCFHVLAIVNSAVLGCMNVFKLWFFLYICPLDFLNLDSLVAQIVKNLPAMWETCVLSLGREDPLEKGMATHSSILAWRSPWAEAPGEL